MKSVHEAVAYTARYKNLGNSSMFSKQDLRDAHFDKELDARADRFNVDSEQLQDQKHWSGRRTRRGSAPDLTRNALLPRRFTMVHPETLHPKPEPTQLPPVIAVSEM